MILDRLAELETRYDELGKLLSDPDIISDQNKYREYSREHSHLSEIMEAYVELRSVTEEIAGSKELLEGKDEEMRELAKEELPLLQKREEALTAKLKIMLLPKDPNDDKNIILEIRAGAGGDESTLFASELYRMYTRYAETQGWTTETLSTNESGINGVKEVIAMIKGHGAYSRLKHESGVHRVQRVPETETQGRRHTSTVTVAVMPEAEEVELDVSPDELRIDTYRSGGAGGQNVNKVETAIRITHVPTGTVVTCQDEKSQHKNKQKAMKILMSRLLDHKIQEQNKEISSQRKAQVGTGDRSEKIRTYNFPQNRVTDHRIGLTLHKLGEIMEGDLTELTESLNTYFQTEQLKHLNQGVEK
ncbi:Peptide chain release factor 1 [hydrothermal vent metagenome]|uniref:Peptide chain release factor 1 n=1 Tax=hydrothermal vent metagenome TaxID=652676 RepID=A0A3B0R970_9ZZZZ